jgi:hypothetical protein
MACICCCGRAVPSCSARSARAFAAVCAWFQLPLCVPRSGLVNASPLRLSTAPVIAMACCSSLHSKLGLISFFLQGMALASSSPYVDSRGEQDIGNRLSILLGCRDGLACCRPQLADRVSSLRVVCAASGLARGRSLYLNADRWDQLQQQFAEQGITSTGTQLASNCCCRNFQTLLLISCRPFATVARVRAQRYRDSERNAF